MIPPKSDEDLAAVTGSTRDLPGFLLHPFLFGKQGKRPLGCTAEKHNLEAAKLGWTCIISRQGMKREALMEGWKLGY